MVLRKGADLAAFPSLVPSACVYVANTFGGSHGARVLSGFRTYIFFVIRSKPPSHSTLVCGVDVMGRG